MNSRNNLLVLLMMVLLVTVGCRKPGRESTATSPSYDPEKDPLVNPPSLFETPPKDITKIATDETLYKFADNIRMTQDNTAEKVTWKTCTVIPVTTSASVCLRLENARVYAYELRPQHGQV